MWCSLQNEEACIASTEEDWPHYCDGRDELVSILHELADEMEEDYMEEEVRCEDYESDENYSAYFPGNINQDGTKVKPDNRNTTPSTKTVKKRENTCDLFIKSFIPVVKEILSNAIAVLGKRRGVLFTVNVIWLLLLFQPLFAAAVHVQDPCKDWQFIPRVYSEKHIAVSWIEQDTRELKILFTPADQNCKLNYTMHVNSEDSSIFINRYSICLHTTYTFKVTSTSIECVSVFQNPPGFPSRPRNPIAIDENPGKVKLSWEEPSTKNGPINGYIVEIDDQLDEYISKTSHVISNRNGNITKAQVRAYNNFFDSMLLSQPAPFEILEVQESQPESSRIPVRTEDATHSEVNNKENNKASNEVNSASFHTKSCIVMFGLIVTSFVLNILVHV